MNPGDPLNDDQLLEAVLTGDLTAEDPRVQERCAADPEFRAELEGLLELAGSLAADADRTQAALREANQAPPAPRALEDAPDRQSTRGIGWWWLPGFVAAAALLVFLQPSEPDTPDFPGAGELLGGGGFTVEVSEPWDGAGLSYTLEGGPAEGAPEDVSSLVEFLLDDGSSLAFPFDGTTWTPSSAEAQTIPAGATWRLAVYDASGALIATYPEPTGP